MQNGGPYRIVINVGLEMNSQNKDSSSSSSDQQIVEIPSIDLVSVTPHKKQNKLTDDRLSHRPTPIANTPLQITKVKDSETESSKQNSQSTNVSTASDDRGWTEKNNLLTVLWMHRCSKTLKARKQKTRNLIVVDKSLQILSIVSASILAVLGVSQVISLHDVINDDGDGYKTASVVLTAIIGFFSICVGITTGVIRYLDSGTMIQQEKEAIRKIISLMVKIESVLYTEIPCRPKASEFLEQVQAMFDSYQQSGDIMQEEVVSWKVRIKKAKDISERVIKEQNSSNTRNGSNSLQSAWDHFSPNDERDRTSVKYKRNTKDTGDLELVDIHVVPATIPNFVAARSNE